MQRKANRNMPRRNSVILTTAQSATGVGNGAVVDAQAFRYFSFYIIASAVTTGATVKIEALVPDGTGTNWVQISSTAVAATGITLIEKQGVYSQVRSNITAR